MSYGAQVKFGLARQASANSWVTDPGSYHGFPFVNESVGPEIDEIISQNLTGQFEQGASFNGINRLNGTIEFELTPRNLGAALAAVVDETPVTVTSGSVKTYLFLPNTIDFSSTLVKAPWSIYKQFSDSNSAELYYDAQFGQLEFTLSQGALIRGRLTVAGGTRKSTGIGSMAVAPATSDVGKVFPWSVASISYAGAGIGNFSELTVSLNENIEPIYTLNGTLAPFKYTRRTFREVTINGTFYMTDRVFQDNFNAGTQGRLLVTIVNTLTAIQSGYYNQLTIDVPQFKVTAFKPSAQGPGEVAVPVTGRGILDPSSAYAVQYTLSNTYGAGY